MNQRKAQRLLKIAIDRLERDEPVLKVMQSIKASVEELGDPFAGEIDEYLEEKSQTGGDDPGEHAEQEMADEGAPVRDLNTPDLNQKDLEQKLEEEGSEVPDDTVDDDSPQEQLEDQADEEQEEAGEDKVEELERKQRDLQKEIEQINEQTDRAVESSLRAIARVARERGHDKLATKFAMASDGGIVETLNDLLMKEHQQHGP